MQIIIQRIDLHLILESPSHIWYLGQNKYKNIDRVLFIESNKIFVKKQSDYSFI